MAGESSRVFFTAQFSVLFLCVIILNNLTNAFAKQYPPQFKDLPIAVLQRHIQVSRHLPLCIIFRNHGAGSKLESSFSRLWGERDVTHNYSSWEVGSFAVDHVTSPPIALPQSTPTLRCYLGSSRFHDYPGPVRKEGLKAWLHNMCERHADQLPEATVELVESTTRGQHLTLLGFSGLQKHHQVEEMLAQVREDWSELVQVLFVHPHSPDVRVLRALYNFSGSPSVVFIENTGRTRNRPEVVMVMRTVDVTRRNIDLYLTLRLTEAHRLNTENFEYVVMRQTKYYIPMLVLLYTRHSPFVLEHLRAFRTVISDAQDLGLNVRFGLLEVNNAVRSIFDDWIDHAYAVKFPVTILFYAKWSRTAVVGINQTPIRERPTPATFIQVVMETKLNQTIFRTKDGETVVYQPWGSAGDGQMTWLYEGPSGSMCSDHSHNATDNTPIIRLKQKHFPRQKAVEKRPKLSLWHERFGLDSVEENLVKFGQLPLVTAGAWQDVIEKSHVPRHPFYPGGKWRGEVTKVALVIFIMADCHSCETNMETFNALAESVKHVEGGTAYLVNCTSEKTICEEQGILGFPTLVTYRGLGWLEGSQCVSPSSSQKIKLVRMDYFGVLTVQSVMEWFSSAGNQAVTNLRFEEQDPDFKNENVRLVATVIPVESHFLSRRSYKRSDYFPYECYRLACERLYSDVSCYAQYSDEIPRSEYSDDDLDMVITKVVLYRSDSVSATVMELGRSLYNTLEEESQSSVHSYHSPHRYKVKPRQKCEDDHAACTDVMVEFTHDHGRLPISQMSLEHFHTQSSMIFQDGLPVLLAFVHQDNITERAKFLKSLRGAAHELYNEMVFLTVNIEEFPLWTASFAPKKISSGHRAALCIFPRICIIDWQDHHHAAFYPEFSAVLHGDGAFRFTRKDIVKFVREYLKNPSKYRVDTEHF